MRLQKKICFIAFMTFGFTGFAQDEPKPASNKKEYDENYKTRIQQTQIQGQYIPKDLPDAFAELVKLTDANSIEKFIKMTEYEAEHKLYLSLGRWICTNWGFYEGSRMSHYLRESGITFPEDQATAIIIAWHRSLNKKEINFKELRDRMVEKRKKEQEERLKKAKIIKEETLKPAPNSSVKN